MLSMRIAHANGRKVGNGDLTVNFQNKAYFTKRGLTKQTVLHEFYHHLIYVNSLDMPKTKEEKLLIVMREIL